VILDIPSLALPPPAIYLRFCIFLSKVPTITVRGWCYVYEKAHNNWQKVSFRLCFAQHLLNCVDILMQSDIFLLRISTLQIGMPSKLRAAGSTVSNEWCRDLYHIPKQIRCFYVSKVPGKMPKYADALFFSYCIPKRWMLNCRYGVRVLFKAHLWVLSYFLWWFRENWLAKLYGQSMASGRWSSLQEPRILGQGLLHPFHLRHWLNRFAYYYNHMAQIVSGSCVMTWRLSSADMLG